MFREMEGLKEALIKCFSKRNGAQKLISNKYQLEKIDFVHRYEPNLRLYRDEWYAWKGRQRLVDSNIDYEDFFHWLDLGEGKDLDIAACPRAQLEQQRVRYLTLSEREEYEVVVVEGMLVYKNNGEFLNTPGNMEMIYVLSPENKMFIGEKVKGTFHHSSFLNGGDVICAGHLEVHSGMITALSASSGHYRPAEENFQCLKKFLLKEKVELKHVQMINRV